MKRLRVLIIPMLIGFSALTFSCFSFGYLQSEDYVQARIEIATNPRAISDMQFVEGWTREYGYSYSAHEVGVMVANQLTARGWHDVWILVEWSSRGYVAYPYPYPYPYLQPRVWAASDVWQISIYRSQSPSQDQATAPPPANTDIFKVVTTGTPSQVRAVIRSGADPNARDKRGETPLMYAAADNSNPAVITILIEAGADSNARGKNGMTALMYAAEDNANPAVVTTLLEAGADAKVKDDGGSTAFDYAANNANLTDTDAYLQLQEASQ